ncbi:MAG: MFS transporter [Ignavibacteriae bacterium HGW-Ignavibacteriae-3]|nr:MAG: MFS transporter [Ignavibacteriae bacterium HGW-Ignavibacteriae-3]
MFQKILSFYKPDQSIPPVKDKTGIEKKYRSYRRSVFLSTTIGYGIYYICRLSINVIKKPIIDEGLLTESQLGIIGSALFFSYAAGKLFNGFLSDRVNIRRFMATGLFVSAIVNLILGFQSLFYVFVILWGINGWFQSIGSTTSVVGLVRWFSKKERGTYYGFGSVSISLGEALTFIVTSLIVTLAGWRFGFWSSGIVGLCGSFLILRYFHDSPKSMGLMPIAEYKNDYEESHSDNKPFSSLQFGLLKNPSLWILALASLFIYVVRYSVNSWGILFLQDQKNYSVLEASSVISISSIFGMVGTISSGLISDKLFNGRRNYPALIFGVVNSISIAAFLLNTGNHIWIEIASMVFFGISIGVLVCYLGGLMAIDVSPKEVSGTVMGIIGIASYVGAGVQDILSGYLIEHSKIFVNGIATYNFTYAIAFWIGSSILSFLLVLFVWNAKVYKKE